MRSRLNRVLLFVVAVMCLILTRTAGADEPWIKIDPSDAHAPSFIEWTGIGSDLHAVRFVDQGRALLAVGDRGTVLRSTDGGQHWQGRPTGTEANLNSLAVSSSGSIVFAVGEGVILRSADAGLSWDSVFSDVQLTSLLAVAALSSGDFIAVGRDSFILEFSADASRSAIEPSGTDAMLTAVIELNDHSTVAVAGTEGKFLTRAKPGASWTSGSTGSPSFDQYAVTDLIQLPEGTLVAVGYDGLVLRSKDLGKSWSKPESKTFFSLKSVTSSQDHQNLVAVGERGAVIVSTDAGASWTAMSANPPDDLGAPGLAGNLLESVVATPDGTLMAVGAAGVIGRSRSAGRQWEVGPPLHGLSGMARLSDGRRVVVVGAGGIALRSDDAGHSWTFIPFRPAAGQPATDADVTEDLQAVAEVADKHLIVLGDAGSIYRGTADGLDTVPVFKAQSSMYAAIVLDGGKTVIAGGDDGAILSNDDAGQHFTARHDGNQAIRAFAVSGRVIVAVGGTPVPGSEEPRGLILRSVDHGLTWTPLQIVSGPDRELTGVVALRNDQGFLATDKFGVLWRGDATGSSWTKTDKNFGMTEAKLVALRDGALMLVGNKILRSEDDGASWTSQMMHASTIVDYADTAAGDVAIGLFGTIYPVGDPRVSTPADEFRFSSAGDELEVEWRYPASHAVTCNDVVYDIVGANQKSQSVPGGQPQSVANSDNRSGYRVEWSPQAALHVADGTKFRYSVDCTDALTKLRWRQALPQPQIYAPQHRLKDAVDWLARAPFEVKALVAVACLLLMLSLILLPLYVFAPILLVRVHEMLPGTKALDDATDALEKPTAGLAKLFRLVIVTVLFKSGTSRRAMDAWVKAALPTARDNFSRLKVVQDRQIAIELPAILDGKRLQQIGPALDVEFRKPVVALLVTGPGGGGKTTLAIGIAHRMLSSQPAPLGSFPCIPLLIDRDLTAKETADGFLPYLTGLLRAMVGARRLSTGLTQALLQSGRVAVIVDGLSERNEGTQNEFDPGKPGFLITRLVITSRSAGRGVMTAALETSSITSEALYGFISAYIGLKIDPAAIKRPDDAAILFACGQLKSLLHDVATTPLLASIWTEEFIRSGLDNAGRIGSIAELFDAYVERLLNVNNAGPIDVDSLHRDLTRIAESELGEMLTPGWLTRRDALAAVDAPDHEAALRRIRLLLESHLLEADGQNLDLMRISIDPIAEHLVARSRVEQLGSDDDAWRRYRASSNDRPWPDEFLAALQACLLHRGYGRRVPSLARSLIAPLGQDVDRRAEGEGVMPGDEKVF